MPQPLSFRLVCCSRRWPLGLGCLALAAGAAWAEEAPLAEDAKVALQHETAALGAAQSIEINSRILPMAADSAPAAHGVPPGYAGSGATQTQHLDITRWLTPASSGAWGQFGLSLGVSAPSPGAAAPALAPGSGSPASLDLGMRWRSRLDSGRHLDIAAWAQAPQWGQPQDAMNLIWQSQQPAYGTRVEMQWASSRTRGLVPEFGAIGVQLQGGSRLVLRARKGGPMLYYRAKF
ncbi:hypothetical protein [Acidovorax sp. M2(2025)]|uniref:hypothetical protein n=1 Tax=Acidovorax sp. M2(2025) TaxID=3411355 RepID=UPI003BF59E94